MARLKVRLRGQQVGDLFLDEGKVYRAGRKEDNDIVLAAEKGISREHFTLSFANGVWLVELLSKYGVLSHHGEKVLKIELRHGDLFAVPPYEFEYSESKILQDKMPAIPGEMSHQEDIDSLERTMIGVSPSVPFVRILGKTSLSHESHFQLGTGDVWIAGRDSSCHIPIDDQRVSRRQFEIRRSGTLYHIVDLNSANGTFVNGDRVSADQQYVLKSGDQISVLDNIMIFELRDPLYRSKVDALPVMDQSQKSQDIAPSEESQVSEGEYSGSYDLEATPEHGLQEQQQMAVNPYHQSMPPSSAQMPTNFPPLKQERSPIQKLMILLVVLAAGFYIYTEFFQEVPKQAPAAVPKANDSFSKLKPAQQAFVKQTFQMAKNLFANGKYELTRNELQKIFEILPEYEDAKEMDRLSKEAVELIEQKRRQEELEKSRREMEEKIVQQVDICRKQINGNSSLSNLEDCLSSVIAFNPDHPLFQELRQKVGQIVAERDKREQDRRAYQELLAKMDALFAQAAALEKSGSKDDAIDAYEKVIASKLPDARNYKYKAKQRIDGIRKVRSDKAAELIAKANQAKQNSDLKTAITLMKQAKEIDPTNLELDFQIESMMNIIKKKMMEIYQQGILDESFGKVDEAILRWRLIIKEDVPDGEYYKKAYIKLKKYGAI